MYLIDHKNMLHLETHPNQKQIQTLRAYKQSLILQWAISNFVMAWKKTSDSKMRV